MGTAPHPALKRAKLLLPSPHSTTPSASTMSTMSTSSSSTASHTAPSTPPAQPRSSTSPSPERAERAERRNPPAPTAPVAPMDVVVRFPHTHARRQSPLPSLPSSSRVQPFLCCHLGSHIGCHIGCHIGYGNPHKDVCPHLSSPLRRPRRLTINTHYT